jgi:hypothetical protein
MIPVAIRKLLKKVSAKYKEHRRKQIEETESAKTSARLYLDKNEKPHYKYDLRQIF